MIGHCLLLLSLLSLHLLVLRGLRISKVWRGIINTDQLVYGVVERMTLIRTRV